MGSLDSLAGDELVLKVTDYVKAYMSNYDASHDYSHIRRVVSLSHQIAAQSPASPALDLKTIALSALLHDVGDRKYLKAGEDATTMVQGLLVSLGAPEALAQKVQAICLGVSYQSEIKDPQKVVELIAAHPELAVVQDADRLDAIGAVGVGRCFTYGGAKSTRSLGDSVRHFQDKLLKLEGMMKTEPGRKMARERTERIVVFMDWWKDETAGVEEANDI